MVSNIKITFQAKNNKINQNSDYKTHQKVFRISAVASGVAASASTKITYKYDQDLQEPLKILQEQKNKFLKSTENIDANAKSLVKKLISKIKSTEVPNKPKIEQIKKELTKLEKNSETAIEEAVAAGKEFTCQIEPLIESSEAALAKYYHNPLIMGVGGLIAGIATGAAILGFKDKKD